MRRKLLCVILVAVLLCSSFAGVFAFDDTANHWARGSIERAVELGLFNGVNATQFQPDALMTRAMFVTVLGRLAGVDPAAWQYDDLGLMFTDIEVNSYYAPYLAWAVHTGVANGTGGGKFSPDGNVTREQMAHFIANYLRLSGSSLQEEAPSQSEANPEGEDGIPLPTLELDAAPAEETAFSALTVQTREGELSLLPRNPVRTDDLPESEDVLDAFGDADAISFWATDSVRLLVCHGLLRGVPSGSFGVNFAPQKNASRAECATLFCRLIDSIVPPETEPIMPASLVLNETSLILEAGESRNLVATVFPVDAQNQHLVWYSTNPNVVRVDANGVLTAVGEGVEFVFAATCNRIIAQCEVTVTVPHVPYVPGGLGSADMTDDEKDMMIFGQLVDDPCVFYPDDATAKQHLVWVKVNVWILNSDGTKRSSTLSIEVHENIAATVEAIFTEIYNHPEQPPIHVALGWYGPTNHSEHRPGLAIDLNVNENPYIDKNGNIVVGDHYSPETDPYSIPVGGVIDQIFAKYGFTRGIYWNAGHKDYMHYSFYGT